jgi:hypothetical protein
MQTPSISIIIIITPLEITCIYRPKKFKATRREKKLDKKKKT